MKIQKLICLFQLGLLFTSPAANAVGFIIGQPIQPVRIIRPIVFPGAVLDKNQKGVPLSRIPMKQQLPVPVSELRQTKQELTSGSKDGKTNSNELNKHLRAPTVQITRKRPLPTDHANLSRKSGKQAKPSLTKQESVEKPAPSVRTLIQPAASENIAATNVDSSVEADSVQSVSNIHMQSEQVKVLIENNLAKTTINETFRNDSNKIVEGSYYFPVPSDAAITGFTLFIDGKPVQGEILESEGARRQYEKIVRSLIDPGLLEFANCRTIKASIFPIPAHGTRQIQLEYSQLLHSGKSGTKYEFPLKSKDKDPIDNLEIEVKIAAGTNGVCSIFNPSYNLSRRLINKEVLLSYSAQEIVPNRNFSFSISPLQKGIAANLLTHKNSAEEAYFLLDLTPPPLSESKTSKDIVLVADISGSMKGTKLAELKLALKDIIETLSMTDRFNIVCFNTNVYSYKESLIEASPENRLQAIRFIDEIEASGGTNISGAISKSLESFTKDQGKSLQYIILVSDGTPTAGECEISSLIDMIPSSSPVRLFDLGIGYDVNTQLLNELAERHHGKAEYVTQNESIKKSLLSLYEKIRRPVLTDVDLTFTGIEVKDFYPEKPFDIFVGEQQLILGRYEGAGKANLVVHGKLNGEDKTFTFPVSFAAEDNSNSELRRLWAMRRIAALCTTAGTSDSNKDEITALSKQYGVITPYSSFLVKDPNETRASIRGSFAIDATTLQTGIDSVRRARMLMSYKSSNASDDIENPSDSIRNIADKTFCLESGFWVDSGFDPAAFSKKQISKVTFASKDYFDLINKEPLLAKYFSVGKNVIVVLKGQCYRVENRTPTVSI
jgi:Ca-activated chloride channel homolog